ncbi:hypothetical protein [Dietzia sp. ANT_WB102]|uniref:hypothetical protein n=1 Tax=Dietzia sp. ANT_WB102 TaxID=2597345 RepID=UPI0011EEB884|nr:hypothetical protein [Dietzia sp. ANT_WB102]KAA0917289.1 hypothetical protein FQ137_13930 [Dietzia sp. ANT_WB102]
MAKWRKSSALFAVALVGGIVSPIPQAAAAELFKGVVPVTHACQTIFNGTDVEKQFKMGMGTGPGGANLVDVEYPPQVKQGEVFTAYVQPGPMTTSSGNGDGYQAGRLSYDIALPTDAVILGVQSIGGESELSPDTSPIKVDQYANLDGFPTAVARVWGGESVPISSATTGIIETGYWNAGLRVRGGKTFRFPKLAIRMRAPVNQGGNTIAVGLKGAGTHPSGSATNGALNTVQGAHRSGFTIGSYWWSARFYCGSSNNARTLTPTVVSTDSNDRYLAKTSTRLLSEGTHLPRSGRTATLSAEVSSDEEVMANVRGGGAEMRFDIKNKATGAIMASPTATIGTNGVASASYTFPDLVGPGFRNEYEVSATYTGRPNDIEPSTSAPTTYSVGYNEINAAVSLKSTNGQISGTPASMPVTLTADLALPGGKTFPAGMSVQLYRNGVEYRAPIAITAGGSTKQIQFPVDNLPQASNTTTYKYTAKLSPVIINDLDRYAGETAVSVAAIVTGTNPGSPLPGGGHGSLDLTNFFKIPELAWEAIGGSVGEMGTLSVSMGK